jgi:hypothetical protein
MDFLKRKPINKKLNKKKNIIMKDKMILRTLGLFLLGTLLIFSSCSKSADESMTEDQNEQQGKNLEVTSVDEMDLTETDVDLTTVDYKEFYDQLAPHGEWIQIRSEEIGMETKTALNKNSGNNSVSLSNLMSVTSAYASTDATAEMVFVWKPSADLAVVKVEGVTPVYTPYINGQWINTDAGWYFKAPTPAEEIVHHYGRWVDSPTDGWLWVPGRVWAPAWVDWMENETDIAWAPIPPSAYIINNTINTPSINEDQYVIVEKKYFMQPQLYKYMYKENKNKIMIKEMTKTGGIMVKNKTVINKGPEVIDIEKFWGNKIEMVKINKVKVKNDAKFSDNEIFVYTPGFMKIKNSDNIRSVSFKPKTFVKFDERKVSNSGQKELKKEEKDIRKEIKSDNKDKKADDEKGMKYDNKNKNKNDDNGKKNDDKSNKKNDKKGKGNN